MMHSTEPNLSFTPHLTAYSPNHAVALAKAARLAYYDQSCGEKYGELQSQMQDWGFSEVEYECLSKDNTQALVAANQEIAIVAFRGTEIRQLGDWMTDFNICPVEFKAGGFVHSGFLHALNDIWQEITDFLEPFRETQTPIFLTGHSLGGALATLAAVQLQLHHYPVHGLYTFGAPRVGDRQFAQSFDRTLRSRSFRFVNGKDVVPHVAPGYWHVVHRRLINSGTLLQQADQIKHQVKNHLVEILKQSWRDIFLELIADHDMGEYERYLSHELTSQHPSENTDQLPDRSFSVTNNHFQWSAA